MANLNSVFLIGNLTNDPEVKYTKSGNPVAKFGLAVNRRYKKNDEEREDVCFVNIVAWNRLAEVCNQYLRKGKSVFVEGRLNQNKWEEDGKKRSRIEVVAKNVQFLSPKEEDSSPTEEDEDEVPF